MPRHGKYGNVGQDEEGSIGVAGMQFGPAQCCIFVFLLLTFAGVWTAAGFAIANNKILHGEFVVDAAIVNNSRGAELAKQLGAMSHGELGDLVESSVRGVFSTSSMNPTALETPPACANLTRCSFGTCVCEQNARILPTMVLREEMCGFFGGVCLVAV